MSDDIIVEAFIKNYGILSLLEDLDVKKVRPTIKPEYIMCCCFHEDTKESLAINTDNGLFNCFGCGAKGNLYQFVQLSYNLDYIQARNFIASRAGIDGKVNLDDITFLRDLKNSLEKEEDKKEIVKWPEISSEMIQRMYESPDPHDYLKKRGFNDETIKYFECGYTEHYYGTGYKKHIRVTIPGHDEYGKICGFIGRTPIDEQPKYLYTVNYPKAHTLFNLHRAKYHTESGLILVEGSLDAMKIHSLGYPNVCAILGASLSEDQQKLVEKYANKVYLMFDNDKAGYTANKKALEKLKDRLDINVVPLKQFKDPGEIENKKQLDELLKESRSWFEFILQKGGI